MTLVDITYQPGTQKNPQQTELTMQSFVETDHVHFPYGRISTLPPYSPIAYVSDTVEMLGAVRSIHAYKRASANYFIFGSNTRLYAIVNTGLYNITPLQTTAAATLGANPLAVVDESPEVTVTYTAHGLQVGDRFKLTGATDTGGIAAASLNVEHIVTDVPTADTFTFNANADATSTTSGGGSSVEIFLQIAAGQLNQEVATGYGVGLYGEGLYGQGGEALFATLYPRNWSIANFGSDVVMCPGDYTVGDGQKIYIWDGDLEVAPTVLTNAPTDCNWVSVVNNSVVALCGTTIKISEIGNATIWSGLNYYFQNVARVWKLVSCWNIGDKDAVIFTPNEAIFLRYTGGTDIWDLSDLFLEDGILSPRSACVMNTILYWKGYRGAYAFDGGSPVQKQINAQNEDWMFQNINYGKAWSAFAYADTQNGQWYHHFPTGTDVNPQDYVIHNPAGQHWTLGEMSRTAGQQNGFLDTIFYMANSTSEVTAGTVFRHFTIGAVTFNWYAETAFAYVDDGQHRYLFEQYWPDSNQSGTVNVQLITKEFPQGAETSTSLYAVPPTLSTLTTKAGGRLVKHRFSGNVAYVGGFWKMIIRRLGRRSK